MEELETIELCEGTKLLEQISGERGLLWERIEKLNETIEEFGIDADMSKVAISYEDKTGVKIRP